MDDNLVDKMTSAIKRVAQATCDYEHLPDLLNPDVCAKAALEEIPSLSFDEAVEKGIEANRGVIGIEAHSSVKSIVRAAIRALTANGDVLIRRE